eukprot:26052-Eustigmatos_ZCMA.PRE.1
MYRLPGNQSARQVLTFIAQRRYMLDPVMDGEFPGPCCGDIDCVRVRQYSMQPRICIVRVAHPS